MTPDILILAAGSSSRMRGADKLVEPIDGQAQLTRLARAALATGCPVTVALPPNKPARLAALAGLALRTIIVPNAEMGMAESLKAGLATLSASAPVLVLLADLPEIDAADLNALLQAWRAQPEAILRATAADGTPGHPVCFPPWTRDALMALTGDEGARTVLKRHADKVRLFALPRAHATTDLDTPEDWAAWRAARRP